MRRHENGVGLVIALGALLLGGVAGLSCAQAAPAAGARLVAGGNVALVTTTSGRVQGFVRDGIETYRGVPYAQAARFEDPQPAPAWTATRPALSWGPICPQAPAALQEPQLFISDNRFWPQSENCQNLNVWTPSSTDGRKRPVLVWIHGGGFFSGASMELPIYDGTRLSRQGDIVVVSINHRLNVLGFLDLSSYGERYRHSANVGMLDIVAALRWVRDNVGRFGGDPANVTIFGQSGGGAKVATLMTMPAAAGLFHKAIVTSGAPSAMASNYSKRTVARAVAERTLAEAGIAPSQVDRLAQIPYEQLLAAANRALEQAAGPSSGPIRGAGLSWAPVVDGEVLPESPFATGAPALAKGVPLLIGSTLSEFAHFPRPDQAGRETWTDAQVDDYLRRTGPNGEAVLAGYRQAYPSVPHRQWLLVDTMLRPATLRMAALQAGQGAPVYNYLFAWQAPVLDYAWAAGHSSDLAFIFDNAEAGLQSSGGGRQVDRLAAEMSAAWIHFIRSGDPNGRGVTHWAPYTPERPATLVFDAASRLRIGHDADLMKALAAPRP